MKPQKGLARAILLSTLCAAPSWAFFDAAATAAKSIKDEIYQKFMMAKAVEQIKALRDNYMASMRYYDYFRQLNEGKGLVHNFSRNIAAIGEATSREAQAQLADDWVRDPGRGSGVDRLVRGMDDYASAKVRYAGKVFETAMNGQKEAEKLLADAATMDRRSPQRRLLEGQAWSIQLQAQTNANLAQLIDLNTRIYHLQLERKKQETDEWRIFKNSAEKIQQRLKEEISPKGWFR